MQTPLPLSGIRVIDFGRFIAGPYCAMLLADMGADVIRVDRRQGSEDRYLAPVAETGEGTGFLSLNRNKRSISLDLGKREAAEVVRRLVRTADVIVANLPLEVLQKMGLDYEALKAVKPDIILARISTFGPDGPLARCVGFDAVAQAMTGAMSLTGFPGAPVRSVVPFEDYGTALHTAFGVMVALYHRAQTGAGQVVDGSLLATGITFMQNILAERQVLGIERQQIGNTSFYAAPADCYRTRDGWIMVSIVGAEMFARWVRLVGRPEFIGDSRFSTDQNRAENHAAITEAMDAWLASRTTAQAIAELQAARIPAGPVLDPQQVLEHSQVRARKLLQEVEFPGTPAPVPVAAPAVGLSATPARIRHRAPMLGEHTDEVLREIGYSESEITALRKLEAV
ncbi:MAG TPA: CoA transferase [Candidatus Acidoferrales bacterium]|nr:CoA transferase [Candidatus Acidoferrales bacterium]